ncbi:MAG: hypothetical protein LW724_20370 [Planctomycetaceae bacterium]|nr:hypothetical protein [Planctomycetaceae bacterium]
MSEAIERNCPASIRDCHQWVAWKYVERGGKPTKAPINPHNGLLASSTDQSTWGTFSQAMQACERNKSLAGVGFVFSLDDPYCGVDLDDSINESTGELKPWAQQIVDRLDSYTEISPSGLGLKVFIKASKPGSRCRKAYHDGEVEIYDRDRFFTVTGNRIATAPSEVNVRQESLDAVYAQVFGNDEPGTSATPSASRDPQPHSDVARRARSFKLCGMAIGTCISIQPVRRTLRWSLPWLTSPKMPLRSTGSLDVHS